MSIIRCPECECLLKNKDLKNDKCWKCGLTPIVEIIEKEQKLVQEEEKRKNPIKWDEKEKKKQKKLSDKKKREQKLKNRTLSQKYSSLEPFRIFLIVCGIISTFLVIIVGVINDYPLGLVFLFSFIPLFIMWFVIISNSRMIKFLFELDKRKSDKE
jgi:hypothetical protein